MTSAWKILAVLTVITTSLAQGSEAGNYVMMPDEFSGILNRECQTELGSRGKRKWREATSQRWWNPKFRTFPENFIICDKTKNKSGVQRREIIESRLAQQTTSRLLQERTKLQRFPLKNTDDSTCYLASIPVSTARKVAKTEENCKNGKNCVIQPFLSMMKIGKGTLAAVNQAVDVNVEQNAFIQISVRLSPAAVQRETELEETLQSLEDRNYKEYVKDLKTGLPFTGRDIANERPCDHSSEPCNIMRDQIFVDQSIGEDQATLYLFYDGIPLDDDKENDSQEVSRDRLLHLITGLAARPEITYVGIESSTVTLSGYN